MHDWFVSRSQELDRSKVGQSEERTIYEVVRLRVVVIGIAVLFFFLAAKCDEGFGLLKVQQGEGRVEVDFCAMDGGADGDLLQQRYRDVSRRRDELQHLEVELRAQIVARAEILEMQRSFGAQMSEHVNANVELKVGLPFWADAVFVFVMGMVVGGCVVICSFVVLVVSGAIAGQRAAHT